MAKSIANINGIDVFSDKQVRSMSGTRIDFHDGSWCDVVTGQVVNNGIGYITIGTKPSDALSNKITKGPETFASQPLTLKEINADVKVATHSHNYIEVTISGPEDLVKKIKIFEKNGSLFVEGDGKKNNNITTIIGKNNDIFSNIISGFGSVVSNSRIVINSQQNDTIIEIKVPCNTPININNIYGETTIGDTEGPINIITSSGDVTLGKVTDTDISIHGSGEINIDAVNGSLNGMINGSGKIKVEGGNVTNLFIRINGSGKVKLKGRAKNANVVVNGSGKINIAYVETRPVRSINGSGDIKIGNW